MPGWHDSTSKDQKEGRLKMIGIVQEQHADRARLFMQWKEMKWPLMFDPMNQLGVDVVPITLLIDEAGIVRSVNPSRDDLSEFLDGKTPDAAGSPPAKVSPPDMEKLGAAVSPGDDQGLLRYAEALTLWGKENELSSAISIFQQILERRPDDGALHFRTGVAYRKRFDSAERVGPDFQYASRHWTQALELNPNQYIWRRRIQQYGPRLQKPYAFFDWVDLARSEIRERGEQPVSLLIEPRGAELAAPARQLAAIEQVREPDPRARIFQDVKGFIKSEITVVPAVAEPGQSVRVHIELRPNKLLKAHWNNEANGLVFWASPHSAFRVDKSFQELESPKSAVSTETRNIELEVEIQGDAHGSMNLETYALYYVCEDVNGTCLYRRLNIPISIEVKP